MAGGALKGPDPGPAHYGRGDLQGEEGQPWQCTRTPPSREPHRQGQSQVALALVVAPFWGLESRVLGKLSNHLLMLPNTGSKLSDEGADQAGRFLLLPCWTGGGRAP